MLSHILFVEVGCLGQMGYKGLGKCQGLTAEGEMAFEYKVSIEAVMLHSPGNTETSKWQINTLDPSKG